MLLKKFEIFFIFTLLCTPNAGAMERNNIACGSEEHFEMPETVNFLQRQIVFKRTEPITFDKDMRNMYAVYKVTLVPCPARGIGCLITHQPRSISLRLNLIFNRNNSRRIAAYAFERAIFSGPAGINLTDINHSTICTNTGPYNLLAAFALGLLLLTPGLGDMSVCQYDGCRKLLAKTSLTGGKTRDAVILLHCGHVFHPNHLSEWLRFEEDGITLVKPFQCPCCHAWVRKALVDFIIAPSVGV